MVLTREQLIEKKAAITQRMQELMSGIRKVGISANQQRFAPHTINQVDKLKKDKLVKEYTDLTKEVIEINKSIKKLNSSQDFFRAVVKESLPEEAMNLIIAECKRREEGKYAELVNIDFVKLSGSESTIKNLRKFLLQYNSKFIAAREALTEYLSSIKDPNVLRQLSKINTSIPPIAELKKDRVNFKF